MQAVLGHLEVGRGQCGAVRGEAGWGGRQPSTRVACPCRPRCLRPSSIRLQCQSLHLGVVKVVLLLCWGMCFYTTVRVNQQSRLLMKSTSPPCLFSLALPAFATHIPPLTSSHPPSHPSTLLKQATSFLLPSFGRLLLFLRQNKRGIAESINHHHQRQQHQAPAAPVPSTSTTLPVK